MAWIAFTLLAAFMQAWRNALQKKVRETNTTSAATLSRFLYASPLALVYLLLLYQGYDEPIPEFNSHFVRLILQIAMAQIMATIFMVMLFHKHNYVIGAGLAKSEAMLTALLGVVWFSVSLSGLAWLGVIIGTAAVWVMSSIEKVKSISFSTLVLGLSCGLCFALTSLWIREASLLLETQAIVSAAWVLLLVICSQCLILGLWMLIKEPQALILLFKRPALPLAVSVCSMVGSLGWFSAMSLEIVPKVKTLGMVEVGFTILISLFWLKENIKKRDYVALALISVASTLIIWG